MNIKTAKTEELQKIVDDAPEQAMVWNDHKKRYQFPSGNGYYAFLSGAGWRTVGFEGEPLDSLIQLSEIRAELESRPKFKVGDRVVLINPCAVAWLFKVVDVLSDGVNVVEIFSLDTSSTFYKFSQIRHAKSYEKSAGQRIEVAKKATRDEITAGHRIDELKSNNYQARLSEAKAHIESLPEWQRQGLNDAMNASHQNNQFSEDLRSKPCIEVPEFEQADDVYVKEVFKVGDWVLWSEDQWKQFWQVISDECEGQVDLKSDDNKWHFSAFVEDLRNTNAKYSKTEDCTITISKKNTINVCQWDNIGDSYTTQCGATVSIKSKTDPIFYYCCYCGLKINLEHQSDAVTIKIDQKKCGYRDVTVHD